MYLAPALVLDEFTLRLHLTACTSADFRHFACKHSIAPKISPRSAIADCNGLQHRMLQIRVTSCIQQFCAPFTSTHSHFNHHDTPFLFKQRNVDNSSSSYCPGKYAPRSYHLQAVIYLASPYRFFACAFQVWSVQETLAPCCLSGC